jgi:predicted nucleic acid-binding protein
VDTNILVYAANLERPEYRAANRILEDLRDGEERWFLTWAIIYEFLRVATHPSIIKYPVPAESALVFGGRLIHSP